MKPLFIQQNKQAQKSNTLPLITLAVQTDAAIVSKTALEEKLTQFVEQVEVELDGVEGICDYIRMAAVSKLKSIIKTLQHNANTKSIIIFLAPFVEQVYYLNFLIAEKVSVGQHLKMRDLVLTKKKEEKYLLLLLGDEQSIIYEGNGGLLKLIVYNSTGHINASADKSEHTFYKHADNVLSHILKSHSLPLIAVANETTLAAFKSISKNSNDIILTISSNHYDTLGNNIPSLNELMLPLLTEWETFRENYLKIKLEKALSNKNAETGIEAVYKAVKAKRGTLLIVERDFYYPIRFTDSNGVVNVSTVSSDGSLLISDAVDDIIERVIANGGNVEFVTSNILINHMHIALISEMQHRPIVSTVTKKNQYHQIL